MDIWSSLKNKMSNCLVCPFRSRKMLQSKADLTLAGEIVLDGTDFRNGAHLRFKADLFVPCGGRQVI